jgi:short-subunit dehydrogenase
MQLASGSYPEDEIQMKVRLKPIERQTIVITGGSSGIGLATARLAAEQGANVVLAGRNMDALEAGVQSIRAIGGQATYVVADVAEFEQVDVIAEAAIAAYGGFDTWINNAGVGMYGRLDEMPLADKRQLFDVNFWGTVHGCRSALPHLAEHGGAIINIGSVMSDRTLPLLGIYSASKAAVQAYTDALRMDLEEAGVPIAVTLVKPSSIDTPFFHHARNYMPVEPKPSPPVYAPEVVARTILTCAERPTRDVTIGGGGRLLARMGRASPRVTDKYMEATQFDAQQSDAPELHSEGELYAPFDELGRVHGGYRGHVMRSSLYTTARMHPRTTTAAAVGLGLAAVLGMRAVRKSNGHDEDDDR